VYNKTIINCFNFLSVILSLFFSNSLSVCENNPRILGWVELYNYLCLIEKKCYYSSKSKHNSTDNDSLLGHKLSGSGVVVKSFHLAHQLRKKYCSPSL
jgi:hypothetical protein